MIERRVRVIPQREEEFFYVDGLEFDTENEAKEHVRDKKIEDAFVELTNEVRTRPVGIAYYGSYGEKKICPTDYSLRNWLTDNSQFVMQFCAVIGDLDNETK